MPRDRQKLAVDVPYGIFMKEGNFPNEIRRAALERVAMSMLRVVHTSALTEFFMEDIKEIMKIIEAKQSRVCTSLFYCNELIAFTFFMAKSVIPETIVGELSRETEGGVHRCSFYITRSKTTSLKSCKR